MVSRLLQYTRNLVLVTSLAFVAIGTQCPAGEPAPKTEIRAAWITTVNGLDWPTSGDPIEQRRSLVEIVERLHAARFNTIYFQVRGRADAMYRSAYEPWSPQLAGALGKDPGWDPLSVILAKAHALGMEVHAWFNTFIVRTVPRLSDSRPRHVTLIHPDWVQESDGEWWMNPGLPAVRSYTVSVAMDIVRNYDIDGLHLDFARYPAKGLRDESTFEFFGKGMRRSEWRRGNINAFMKEIRDSVRTVRPAVKIGAAPIGVYDASVWRNALHSYDDVFQDSRLWIREGYVDYLVPQMYWPISRKSSEPDFAVVARNWSDHSASRHVIAGIGVYKEEVAAQVTRLIDSSRAAGLAGQAFFRYQYLEPLLDLGNRYSSPALIPPTQWLDSVPPLPPTRCAVANLYDGVFQLEWTAPLSTPGEPPPARYAVYRSLTHPVDITNPENLLCLLDGGTTSLIDSIQRPKSPVYYYTVTALDRQWNESPSYVEEGITIPEIVRLARRFDRDARLDPPVSLESRRELVIPFEIANDADITFTLVDAGDSTVLREVSRSYPKGRHLFLMKIPSVPPGTYTLRFKSGFTTMSRMIRISG